jgi:hypothetical protein
MKKLILGLIATVMFTSLSFAQTSSIDYFNKPIFKLIEKSKPDLYNELTANKIEIQNINGKEVVFLNLKNGYFLDVSSKMIYAEINKGEKTITVNDITSNSTVTLPLKANGENVFNAVDENHITKPFPIFDSKTVSNSNVTFSKPCADSAGFAICYSLAMVASLAIAASDGPLPLMDTLAISYLVGQTAYCHRSHCGW